MFKHLENQEENLAFTFNFDYICMDFGLNKVRDSYDRREMR